tara:strand:+ start:2513 stop:3079 length:567 start_codon:yes stop_codon:yes gene_type:complete
MASQLGFSEIDFNKESSLENKPRRRRNKTIKKKEPKTEKVKQFLNSLEDMNKNDNTLESMDNANLEDFNADFNPPSTLLTKTGTEITESFVDPHLTPENFENLDENQARNQEYYKQFVPYYKQASNNANLHGSRDELMEKLNYIVQVLEETKDEKTENISEELVLYMFLGVFVIFVVDSFARAGKYTR